MAEDGISKVKESILKMNELTEDNAIVIRDVGKTFSFRRIIFHVLQDLNITVPKGTIYALLGPSGCGKTTLLRCILGRLTINEGTILVYDNPPNIKKENSPKIGYMPQDIALTEELTIDETLRLFGAIAGMNSKQIKEKCEFLVKFLEMPYHNKQIGRLSDGQKRRASLAVALINDPDLLLLDEPTVGVDPPLRKSIWKYLYTIAKVKNATIIVTTHYIEEAHMAHNVGLMLNGAMVAEAPPDVLIQEHGCGSLEKVFLKLCLTSKDVQEKATIDNQKYEEKNETVKSSEKIKMFNTAEKVNQLRNRSGQSRWTYRWPFQCPNSRCIWALFLKNISLVIRNPTCILLEFGLPSIIMVLFAFAIGKPLFALPVGIVNHDSMDFSTLYLDSISNYTISQVHYDDYGQAFKDAKNGKIWGVVYLQPNFTTAVISRYTNWILTDDRSLNLSSLSISLDLSNLQISHVVQFELLFAFRKFLHSAFPRLGLRAELGDLPLKYEKRQVYGSFDTNYAEFLCPSFMLHVTFFLAMSLTTMSLVVDRQSGSLDRLYISGVDYLEVAFALLFSQMLILVVQILLIFGVVFGIFNFVCLGSYVSAAALCLLQGLCGMTMGIFISAICERQTVAILCCLATFFMMTALNSVFWPIEGMALGLKTVSLMLPQTYSFKALRGIMSRGWDLSHSTLLIGFSITIGWSAIFIILAMIIVRLK